MFGLAIFELIYLGYNDKEWHQITTRDKAGATTTED
jgi:hypothetical protein